MSELLSPNNLEKNSPKPTSGFLEGVSGSFAHQLYGVHFTNHSPIAPMYPPSVPPNPFVPADPIEEPILLARKIENALEVERQKLSTLTKNAAILEEHLSIVKDNLLENISIVQMGYEDFLNHKAAIAPILARYKTYSFFEYAVERIESVLNLFQPKALTHFLNIDTQTHIKDFLQLKNMIGQYDHQIQAIHHKAQQVAIDEIDTTNKIEAFCDKVHRLHDCCNHLVSDFNNISTGRELLRDIKAQIEGRSENVTYLETLLSSDSNHSQRSLSSMDVFNDCHLGHFSVGSIAKTQQTPYTDGQIIHLEIPGFCAQWQVETTNVL